MKKILNRIVTSVLTIAIAASFSFTGAVAATPSEPSTGEIPLVRVNGYIVSFPDAQPYIDANDRTLIPVRFVAEQLGADVSWDNDTETATIEKNGITEKIQIGNSNLTVIKNGVSSVVTMDTRAVLSQDRTYVPIRFVAEQLGAYIDFSDYYNVVGIWGDVLTADQIRTLRAYPYTLSQFACPYSQAKNEYDSETLKLYYGSASARESFLNQFGYANAREYLYKFNTGISAHYFTALGKTTKGLSNEEYCDLVVKETVAKINYTSANIEFRFIADTSCIYHEDNSNFQTFTIRGYITALSKVPPLGGTTAKELQARDKYGFTRLIQGKTVCVPVDVHMSNLPDGYINFSVVRRLDAQFTLE